MSEHQVGFFASIQSKVIVITIVVVTTILGCFAAVDISMKSSRMQQDLLHSTEITATRLADNLKLPLWDLNKEVIEDTVAAELLAQDVYAVGVFDYDKDKQTLFAGSKRDSDWNIGGFDGLILVDLIKRSAEIAYNDETIGRVDVYLSPRFMNEELLRSVRSVAITVLLLDLSIFVVLWLVFRSLLINPISYLSEVAEKISRGSFEQDLRYGNRADEIGMVAQAIGRMQISLRIALRRLAQIRTAAKAKAG